MTTPARKELLAHLILAPIIVGIWIMISPGAIIWGLPCYVIGTICGRYGAIYWYTRKIRRKFSSTEV